MVPRPDDLTDFVARRGWEDLHEDRAVIDEWFAERLRAQLVGGQRARPAAHPAVLEPDNIEVVGGALAEAAASITVP